MAAVALIDEMLDLVAKFIPNSTINNIQQQNALVIVAKWPVKGKSKTRLATSIGPDLAGEFAMCALKDLLLYFSKISIDCNKFLLYAPHTCTHKFHALLKELNLSHIFKLLLMRDSNNLTTPDLGNKLAGCVQDLQSKKYKIDGSITFMGSDCLELTHQHLINTNEHVHSNGQNSAYIIPAADGGFVCLGLPPKCTTKVFDNVIWSTNETCQSQINAIKQCRLEVVKSTEILSDVDELDDWIRLCKHFGYDWNEQKRILNPTNCVDYNTNFVNTAALLKK